MNRTSVGSVYLRFNIYHLLVWIGSILAISLFTGYAIYYTNFWQVEQHLKTLTYVSSHMLEDSIISVEEDPQAADALQAQIDHIFSREANLEWTIFSEKGIPVLDSRDHQLDRSNPTEDAEVYEAINNDSGESESIRLNREGESALYLTTRIEKDGQIYGVVRMEASLWPALQKARTSILQFIALVGLVTVVVSVLVFVSAGSLTRPIEAITRMVDLIAHGDLDARVAIPTRSPEIENLALAFNQMAERLQVQVSELRSFVANASHELRTPLTVIKLRIEALRNGALDEPEVANKFLAEVEGEVDRLSRMVGDMLDLSRIEGGISPSQKSVVDLATIVCDVKDTMKVRAERAKISINCDVAEDLPPVRGAEDQLRRMLYNLVDNAIKYTTQAGQVELNVRNGDNPDTILLTVKDTGFGISKEQLPHIFERFFRAEATRPRYGPPQGSGLGLSIAKSIVEAHDGKIWAASELGKGTTFFIELPIKEA